MKNLFFKTAMWKGSGTTVERQSTDGQVQRRYSLTPISKRWKALVALLFLFSLSIGQMWATDEVFTFPTSKPSTFVKQYSVPVSSAGEVCAVGGKIYYESYSPSNVSAVYGVEANYLGVTFKAKVDCVLEIEAGNDNSSAGTISIKGYKLKDARLYALYQNAEGADMAQYVLDNASSDDKTFWKNNNVLKSGSGNLVVDGSNAGKVLSGQTSKTALHESAFTQTFSVKGKSNNPTTGMVLSGDTAFVFKAGVEYTIYAHRSSSKIGFKKFTFKPVYRLTWALDDGTITSAASAYSSAAYYLAGTALTAPTVEKAGADFAGWSPAVAATMPAAATTYTATWATACSAGVPGNITKGALTAGKITLTAAGSPASGDHWYWQASADGTSTSDEYDAVNGKEVSSAGTYYLRSSNGTCWNVTAKSIELTAEDFLAHYAITYKKGEYGTGEIAGGEKVEGVAYTLSSERFTRAGYVQTGWSLTDGGTKAYDLGGSYTSDAAQEFFPVWAETSTYVASFACGATAPAGWTFSNDGYDADNKATADYVCNFVAAGMNTPKQDPAEGKDGTTVNDVAFAKNTDAIATYDLGSATTVTALNVTLCGGSGNPFDETIEYVGADGSTVKKTYINSLSAGNWNDNLISKNEIVEDVRYIRVHGASKWIAMKAFSVTYVDLVTKYNVSFDKNGGSGDDMATLKYAEGAEVTLPACTFTAPENKEFDAWTSTDVTISNNKFTMLNKDVTIKATWKFLPKLTLEAGEGATGDDVVAYYAATTSIPVPAKPEGFSNGTKEFTGWVYSSDVEITDGAFPMPSSDLTLTAQWASATAVAQIVGGDSYETFAAAIAAVTDGQTIQLLQDIDVDAQIEIAGVDITIDLNGHKIEYVGDATLPSGVILVHNGASLTINDSSDPDAGSIISGDKAYAAVALTKLGDDASTPATLVVNGGALTGYYYGITGNGSRNNTVITINGGTITGTVGIAIYHPQVGTLTVNDGSLTGVDAAIEMRAGTLVINEGTFTATATEFSCNPNGSGSTTTGAAIAIAQHTTKKDIEVTINGGTFNGVKALNESNPQANDPAPQVDLAITAGTFTGEVTTVDVNNFISGGTFDHEVAANQCAEGYAPENNGDGTYGVKPLATSIDFVAFIDANGTSGSWATYLSDHNYTISSTSDVSLDGGNNGAADKGLKIKKTGRTITFDVAAGKLVTLKVGSLDGGAQISENGGEFVALTGANPLHTGASVKTYYYSADVANYVIKTTGDAYNIIQSVTIEDPYEVSYSAPGADPIAAQFFYGTAITLPTPTGLGDTKRFDHWCTDSKLLNPVALDANGKFTPTSSCTLYAAYKTQYELSFEGNGADVVTEMASLYYAEGDVVAVPACTFEKTGYVFDGWTYAPEVTVDVENNQFTMPGSALVLTAQWVDNSSVVKVVRENYEQKYDNFLAARNDVRDNGGTIIVLQDITDMVYYGVNAAITIDLNGHRLATADGNDMFLVYDGGSLTINGAVDGSQVHGRINVGSNAGSDGTLVLNGGTYTCAAGNTCIHVHGESDNSVVTINGATITSPNDNGVQFNGKGVYTVTDATITGGTGIYIKSGELTITNSTVTGTLTPQNYSYYGNGAYPTGDGIVVDACNYPGGAPTINIISGDFSGTKGAVGSYNYQGTSEPAIGGIQGGSFSSRVPNDLCAEGFVPSKADPVTGKYTVEPKEGICIIKANVGSNTFVIDEAASLFEGTADKNNVRDNSSTYAEKTGWKFTARPARLGLTLSGDETFQAGDVVEVFVTSVANIDNNNDKMRIFDASEATAAHLLYESEADMVQGVNRIVLPATTTKSLYLHRTKDGAYDNFNPFVAYVAVYRPMKPVLTAISFNGEAATKGTGNAFAVTLPEEATDLTSMTIVPSIIRNAAHTTTPEAVITNNGAWQEGANIYRVMDKDGDYTDYTITITLIGQAQEPNITADPETPQAYCAGSEPTLSVTVDEPTDGGTLSYAWFKVVANADDEQVGSSATYTVADAGTYYVVVTNTVEGKLAASATSESAVVTLNTPASITTQPSDLKKQIEGENITLSVVASNATGYQWYSCDNKDKENPVVISGAQSADYEFAAAAGFFYCEVTGACGTVESNVAQVTIKRTAGCQYITATSGSQATLTDGTILYACGSDGKLATGDNFAEASANAKALDADAVGAINKQYFVVKFPVDVEEITIFGQNGSNREVNNLCIGDAVGTDIKVNTAFTDYTKSKDNDGNERSMTIEFNEPFAKEKYLFIKFNSALEVYRFCYTAAPEKCEAPTLPALADQELCEGDAIAAWNATATVTYGGTLSYQWYNADSDEAIEGADDAEFTPSADGNYYVIVTNTLAGYRDNSTKSATLTVEHFAAAAITEELVNMRGAKDAVVQLAVTATGKNLHYAWKESATIDGTYTDVDGADDAASLNVTITEGMSKYYKVVVSSDCGADLESVAKVEQFVPVVQANVTASTIWDWEKAASVNEIKLTDNSTPKKNEGFVMANGAATIYNNANFESDKLYLEGEYIVRKQNNKKLFQGQTIKFNAEKAGVVRVSFSNTGDNAARELYINGTGTGLTSASATAVSTGLIDVPAGEVSITAYLADKSEDASQKYVRVYKVEYYTIVDRRTESWIVPGELGTVCLKEESFAEGATIYELQGIDGGKLVFDALAEGETMQAGKPYLFEAAAVGQISFYGAVNGETTDVAGNWKGMYGTFNPITFTPDDANIYYFSGTHIWAMSKRSKNITVGAYRCYVKMDEVRENPVNQGAQAGRRRVTLGVQGGQVATGIENAETIQEGVQKIMIDGQLFILRGEKMYDATGRLVK